MCSPRLRSPRAARLSGDGPAASTLDAAAATEQRASGRRQWRRPPGASQFPERQRCWRRPRPSKEKHACCSRLAAHAKKLSAKGKAAAASPLVSQRHVRCRGHRAFVCTRVESDGPLGLATGRAKLRRAPKLEKQASQHRRVSKRAGSNVDRMARSPFFPAASLTALPWRSGAGNRGRAQAAVSQKERNALEVLGPKMNEVRK